MDNRCVCCGEIIPEGRQVCINCELTCKDCIYCKWCMEASREYACISFVRKVK